MGPRDFEDPSPELPLPELEEIRAPGAVVPKPTPPTTRPSQEKIPPAPKEPPPPPARPPIVIPRDRPSVAVAWLFQRYLAVIFLIAFWSLSVQVRPLIGSHGLLPFVENAAAAYEMDLSWWQWPTIFRFFSGDGALVYGTYFGAFVSLLALAGVYPRICLGIATYLYLSYATAARAFLGFQWDNLLIECGFAALFLPTDRYLLVPQWIFRLLFFKLYFESGLAKLQSPLRDWHDGSAMTWYFQTLPLPTAWTWYAHNLPQGLLRLSSWLVLALELVAPFFAFGPRPVRLLAFVLFTAFQALNTLTANYGFFTYLSVGLHLFLLDDRHLLRVKDWLDPYVPAWLTRLWSLRERIQFPPIPLEGISLRVRDWVIPGIFAVLWCSISIAEGVWHFGLTDRMSSPLAWMRERWSNFRVINTYYLFTQITRERVEPELQTFDGERWTAHDFRYKPGATERAPLRVAPHQPRLDFQLWFYGLEHTYRTPGYVRYLLDRACETPEELQQFFERPLPLSPAATRIAFWRYRFTTINERRQTAQWWVREAMSVLPPHECGRRFSTRPEDRARAGPE